MRNILTQRRACFAARAALCIAVAAACALPASASEWNKKTKVTFSGPVEVPGKVLPAGTYTFQLLNSNANRDIVQIWNQDRTQLDDTILAIPDYRSNPSGKTVITFNERPSNTPEALRAWFYPGDKYGVQFVYPHQQAVNIAQRSNQNVLATRDDIQNQQSGLNNAKVTGVNPSGQDVDVFIVVERPPSQK